MLKTIIIIFAVAIINSQSISSDIIIGKNYTIYSKALKKEKNIQVHLPKSYEESDKKYPVFYVLDGNDNFSNAVAIQTSLGAPRVIPEMIVIGINLEWKKRRDIMFNTPDKFLSFLVEDVISFVDKTFRTSSERILFGWEASGFYASNILFHKKQLFDGVIATDGAYSDEKTINAFSKFKMPTNKMLFVANSDRDIFYVASSDEFSELLKKTKPNNLTWKYQKFNTEVHESLAHVAMYHGLRYYYYNYDTVMFKDIKTFFAEGGIPKLKEYYKKRGERFGFPTEVTNAAKNNLIWLGLNRDDFKNFEYFMTEFKEVLSTKRYQSNYWQNNLAQFYLKNKRYEKAKYHFEYGIKNFSGSAIIFSGLGNVFLAQNKKKQAILNIRKAIELAEKNSDKNLEKYKKQLNEISRDQ